MRLKLENPTRGRFVTLRIAANVVHNGLHIEFVKFDCVHGDHPLAEYMAKGRGSEAIEKRNEIVSQLRRFMVAADEGDNGQNEENEENVPNGPNGANHGDEEVANGPNGVSAGKGGGLIGIEDGVEKIDNESLTELSQVIADRLSVSPATLDCVMLSPTAEELKRFKIGSKVDVRALQSRFAVIKYLNRLVTPLLHYIDITLFESADRERQKQRGGDEEVKYRSLSMQVHGLKGCYFMSTKKSVFDVLLQSTATSSNTSSALSRHGLGEAGKPRITVC